MAAGAAAKCDHRPGWRNAARGRPAGEGLQAWNAPERAQATHKLGRRAVRMPRLPPRHARRCCFATGQVPKCLLAALAGAIKSTGRENRVKHVRTSELERSSLGGHNRTKPAYRHISFEHVRHMPHCNSSGIHESRSGRQQPYSGLLTPCTRILTCCLARPRRCPKALFNSCSCRVQHLCCAARVPTARAMPNPAVPQSLMQCPR